MLCIQSRESVISPHLIAPRAILLFTSAILVPHGQVADPAVREESLAGILVFLSLAANGGDSPAKLLQSVHDPGSPWLAYADDHIRLLMLGNACANLLCGAFHTRVKSG